MLRQAWKANKAAKSSTAMKSKTSMAKKTLGRASVARLPLSPLRSSVLNSRASGADIGKEKRPTAFKPVKKTKHVSVMPEISNSEKVSQIDSSMTDIQVSTPQQENTTPTTGGRVNMQESPAVQESTTFGTPVITPRSESTPFSTKHGSCKRKTPASVSQKQATPKPSGEDDDEISEDLCAYLEPSVVNLCAAGAALPSCLLAPSSQSSAYKASTPFRKTPRRTPRLPKLGSATRVATDDNVETAQNEMKSQDADDSELLWFARPSSCKKKTAFAESVVDPSTPGPQR